MMRQLMKKLMQIFFYFYLQFHLCVEYMFSETQNLIEQIKQYLYYKPINKNMKKLEKGNLPPYQLHINKGQYPFKNSHISKIFNISVYSQVNMQNKILHKILQAYQSVQSPLLIGIMGLEKIQENKTKIQYQYIDTSLAKYIRRYVHQNIEIKLQKLYIQLRNLANKFVLKNINVMKALNAKNIGVKIADIYRETTFSIQSLQMKKQKKQILMPNFKIFVDFTKCEIIDKNQNIGKIVIETDKMIYNTICADVNALLKKIQSQENYLYKQQVFISMQTIPENGAFVFNGSENLAENQLEFSKNLKKRKRKRLDNNGKKDQQEIEIKNERIMRPQSSKLNEDQKIYNKDLTVQVHDLLQRSRKTLQNFKNKIKIKS